MLHTQRHSGVKAAISRGVAALICATALAVLPGQVFAEAEVEAVPVTFTFNSVCAGELVTITGTLHLMQRPDSPFGGIAEHGNWSNTTAVGLTTGHIYKFAASPTNWLPGQEVFLTNITLIGPGPDAPRLTVTQSAPTFFGPWEVIQEHCH